MLPRLTEQVRTALETQGAVNTEYLWRRYRPCRHLQRTGGVIT
jgi:hypothetical protein